MIHALLVLAVVLFLIWIVFHGAASLMNLLWIAIIVLAVLWLLGFLRRGSSTV